jgi:hypothetical protein
MPVTTVINSGPDTEHRYRIRLVCRGNCGVAPTAGSTDSRDARYQLSWTFTHFPFRIISNDIPDFPLDVAETTRAVRTRERNR